jgi:hypothetical protein
VSQPLEISSQTEKISLSSTTPSPNKSTTISPYPAGSQPKYAKPTVESKISAASNQNSDSGFASDSEDIENVRELYSLQNNPN